jgi:hypothetical protein
MFYAMTFVPLLMHPPYIRFLFSPLNIWPLIGSSLWTSCKPMVFPQGPLTLAISPSPFLWGWWPHIVNSHHSNHIPKQLGFCCFHLYLKIFTKPTSFPSQGLGSQKQWWCPFLMSFITSLQPPAHPNLGVFSPFQTTYG